MKKGIRGKPENPSVVPRNGKQKEGRIQKNGAKVGYGRDPPYSLRSRKRQLNVQMLLVIAVYCSFVGKSR